MTTRSNNTSPKKTKTASGSLVIRGAREYNLKNLHLKLPCDKLYNCTQTVFTFVYSSKA